MNRRENQWHAKISAHCGLVDSIVITISMLTAQLARFGTADVETQGPIQVNYWVLTVALAVVWWFGLGISGSLDIRVLGSGTDEFKRVSFTSVYVFGLLAIFSYAFQLETARGYIAIAFPIGVSLLIIFRGILRWRLICRRKRGEYARRVVVLGGPSAVEHLFRALAKAPSAGYIPIAAILPGYATTSPTGEELPLPVISTSVDLHAIIHALEETGADTLAISSGTALKPRVIRQLGWKLHELGISMIMAPALTDIAGPRIHTQPVAGLPLIHVSTPELEGRQSLVKRTFDLIAAGGILMFLLPVFIVVSVLVKISSPGPVFYAQTRIGHSGKSFNMFKFRSMIVDADSQLQILLDAQGTGDTPLFKVENDPRITRIGRILRQFSIDEIPQLLNVLNGTMSLVGPRPQREAEVALYDDHAHRRLMVKPGMSGLWQVNGRSNLTWEEAIRWDLYYVENWSLTGDVAILLRTFRAVLQKDGAV